MQKNNERLQHALHNEEVCNYMELKPEFNDWLITTSFYSALHFVSYKVFPLKVKGIENKDVNIDTIEQYERYINKANIGRHELLVQLAEKHCNKIASDYSWLKDICKTARYQNYTQSREVANKARSILRSIKKECE